MGSRMATRTPRGMLSGLRQHPALSYYDNRVLAWKFPAMLARVVAGNGTAATLHRTYLHHGQQGAGVCAEEIDGRQACCWGGCAPLPGNGAPCCIAEGIETSLAAAQLFRVPVWSCISTSGLQSFEPPEGVGKLLVFGDNDTNFVGQLAACSEAHRKRKKAWSSWRRFRQRPVIGSTSSTRGLGREASAMWQRCHMRLAYLVQKRIRNPTGSNMGMMNAYRMTPQQKLFATGVVSGQSLSDAFRAAFPRSKKWRNPFNSHHERN